MKPLPNWEYLTKRMIWRQLNFLRGVSVLDFGSGSGATAEHFAECCKVTAVEPSADMLAQRDESAPYTQLAGGIELIVSMADNTFDAVLCHNVMEYVTDQPAALRELTRVLKPGGCLSIIKHNPAGRVMQMAVLLNDFDTANAVLSGGDGFAKAFGTIHYYRDDDVARWCPELCLERVYGLRTFWDLQQNQEIQSDPDWRERMLALEHRVSVLPEYQAVAFHHHLIFRKNA